MRHEITKATLLVAFAAFAPSCAAFADVSPTSGGCAIEGPDDAPVTIEEFADFNCKFCATGAATMKEVLKSYRGKVKLVFRNFPLLKVHPGALVAAKAFSAVCLQSPSQAYAFQDALFASQDQLIKEGEPFLYETAESLGVDITRMKSDMQGESVAKAIANDQRLAEFYHFEGTPSYMIGTKPVVGSLPLDEYRKVIDEQLGR